MPKPESSAPPGFRLLLLSALVLPRSDAGRIVINEVSDRGTTSGDCGGADWVELFHAPDGDGDAAALALGGYVLHDDSYDGTNPERAFVFPSEGPLSSIDSGAYLVLCAPGPYLPFRVGGDDTLTLLDMGGSVASSVGPLPDRGMFDATYARLPDDDDGGAGGDGFGYTTVPTPGGPNVHEPNTNVGWARKVVINEISDKGTAAGDCGNSDWVELHYVPSGDADAEPLPLSGYVLHDDRGPSDGYVFPSTSSLSPGDFLVVCAGSGLDPGTSARFGIGGDDTITLLDASGSVASRVGPLPGRGDAGVTYARLPDGTEYDYTATPTPGEANDYEPLPAPETLDEMRERLEAQNAEGDRFFGMDLDGYPVPDRFENVVDLKIEMDEADFAYTMENRSYEVYRPFISAKVLSRSSGAELLSLASPGRIRSRGQASLFFPTCMDIDSIPFGLEFDHVNKDQTLFGASKVYLRNTFSDASYMREWVQYRMLARFGLPHLRTRTARFFINDNLMGLYNLMEAPDQDYVFARSFPEFDPTNYALYKIKTMSLGCGSPLGGYTPATLAAAAERMNETSTPPYAWERGEHRDKDPVLGMNVSACARAFGDVMLRQFGDTPLAYLRHGEDCGKMVVSEGLVDRDLGVKSWDPIMEAFYNKHLGNNTCSSPGCTDSDLATEVDLTNFLKIMAFYAVVFNLDTPLGSGNNYYLAQTGDGNGWKIVPYDLDLSVSSIGTGLCNVECGFRMVHWSIMRPTCRVLEESQLAGPLLLDAKLSQLYIGHIRDFAASVLTNATFLEEIMYHARAIQADVESDVFNQLISHDYTTELSPDAAEWYAVGNPLLATLKARTEDVMAQLQALDSGSDAYRPTDEVGPWETCIDWRRDPPEPTCPNNCMYEGCYEPLWAVPAFCDMETGNCIHGDVDAKCDGIENLQQYPGMEPRGEEYTFCWDGYLKLSMCPPPTDTGDDSAEKCHKNCMYEGCFEPSWQVPGFCEEATGTCYHGHYDANCEGIENEQTYPGMEPRGQEQVFCWDNMKMSACLPPADGGIPGSPTLTPPADNGTPGSPTPTPPADDGTPGSPTPDPGSESKLADSGIKAIGSGFGILVSALSLTWIFIVTFGDI